MLVRCDGCGATRKAEVGKCKFCGSVDSTPVQENAAMTPMIELLRRTLVEVQKGTKK